MIRHTDLKIIDRDFHILQQLNEHRYTTIANGGSGGVCERVSALINLELIESKRGYHGGHRLLRPLSDILFSHWIDMIGKGEDSPTLRLLELYGDMSVDDLLGHRPYKGAGWTLPLDHAIMVLSQLSTEKPTLARLLNYMVLNEGYIAHIYTVMCRSGLTIAIPRKGVILARQFDRITIGDILPVISHRGRVFSAMAKGASDVKLTYLTEGLINANSV